MAQMFLLFNVGVANGRSGPGGNGDGMAATSLVPQGSLLWSKRDIAAHTNDECSETRTCIIYYFHTTGWMVQSVSDERVAITSPCH